MSIESPSSTRHKSIQAGKHIEKKILELESDLLLKKNFDYQFMHPSDATQLFLDTYISTYQRYWKMHRDIDESLKKFGVGRKNLFENSASVITSIWKSRQTADRIGCPYDFYLSGAFKHLIDNRIWKRLPAPNQLVTEEVVTHVERQWETWAESGFRQQPSDPRFQDYSERDTWLQKSFRKWLIKELKAQPPSRIPMWVGGIALSKNYLSEAQVVTEFGQEILSQSKANIMEGVLENATSERDPDLSPIDFQPGCCGIPHGHNELTCGDCDFVVQCNVSRRWT